MTLHPATYSTRAISLVMIAAFVALALWLFAPFGQGSGGAPDGESAPSQLPSMLRVDGPVQVETDGGEVTRLVVPISVRGDDGIDLSSGKLRAETEFSETAIAAVPTTYSVEWQSGNGDEILDPDEKAFLTVDIPSKSNVTADNPLRLVFAPVNGPTLIIEDVLP
jgi:hypothetical protein